MPEFNGQLSRVTSHRKPRHQLYQPGFNRHNSCWLDGKWIDVPEKDFPKRKAVHERMYRGLKKAMEAQHHRDKATALKDMTPAQRQAWEFYSGSLVLEGFRNGSPSPCGIEMAGSAPTDRAAAWLVAEGFKFPRWVRQGPKAKPRDQLRGLKMPAAVVDENTKDAAHDFVTAVVRGNQRKMGEMFDSLLESIDSKDAPSGAVMGMDFKQFAANMALESLLRKEEDIVRAEWDLSRGEHDGIIDLAEERKEYVEMRAKAKAKISNLEEALAEARGLHNECERANLDSSNGLLYCYVLPKFNDDGSHDPVGERDVPWGQKPRRAPKVQEATA